MCKLSFWKALYIFKTKILFYKKTVRISSPPPPPPPPPPFFLLPSPSPSLHFSLPFSPSLSSLFFSLPCPHCIEKSGLSDRTLHSYFYFSGLTQSAVNFILFFCLLIRLCLKSSIRFCLIFS